MSAFTGPQGKGAMRAHRTRKRTAAAARDAALSQTSPKRKSLRLTIDRLEQAFLTKGEQP